MYLYCVLCITHEDVNQKRIFFCQLLLLLCGSVRLVRLGFLKWVLRYWFASVRAVIVGARSFYAHPVKGDGSTCTLLRYDLADSKNLLC